MMAKPDWPAEDLAAAKLMWADGKSATDIASVINKSRASIQGKLWRMGIKREGKKVSVRRRSPRPRMHLAVPRPVALPGSLVRLLDLTDDNCRYHVGDVGQPGAGFCPEARIELRPDVYSPYCGAHHELTHQPPRER